MVSSSARVLAAGLDGIEAYPVDVEVEVSGGLPTVKVVGLPDAALREARERVRAAIRASGYPFPLGNVTVNLAPARRRKEEGAAFDLPAALGILAAHEPPIVPPDRLAGVAALGELSLLGHARPLRGALAAGEALAKAAAQEGEGRVNVRRLLVARESAVAAALGADGAVEVLPVDSLADAVGILLGHVERRPLRFDQGAFAAEAVDDGSDLDDVRGADVAKQALVVAAAGGHDLLLMGPPGAGKTMLARRLPGLLPALRRDEQLEVTRIHAAAAATCEDGLVRTRPFRSPHHTASYAALVGGGCSPRPGEVSLAHRGVLFLDELPEFHPRALEALREPLEERSITVARAKAVVRFPADFLLVAAMNPCPCGWVGDPRRACRCPPAIVERYAARVSGPLRDRIDIMARVPAPSVDALTTAPGEQPRGSEVARAAVTGAREVQTGRGGLNARLSGRQLDEAAALTKDARLALRSAAEGRLLTGRGVTRVTRVARTLADLDGRERVSSNDVALAIHLRFGEAVAA